MKLDALFAPAPKAQEALRASRYRQRLSLLGLLRRFRRPRPIDAFLDDLAAQDPAALALLLPFGSRPVVERHFAGARQLGGDVFWRRLAGAHSELAAEVIESDLSGSGTPDARLVHEATRVLSLL